MTSSNVAMRRRTAVLAVLTLLLGAALAPARSTAADPAPYGQLARWGAFGDLQDPGDDVAPQGFGVDPGDGNAVYVVERQSVAYDTDSTTSTFGLRKFQPSDGTVLESATPFTTTTDAAGTPPITQGVAIDSANGLAYVAVIAPDDDGNWIVQQIRVYSTSTLGAPEAFPTGILRHADSGLVNPQGIAVDPVTHDVEVLGSVASGADQGKPLVRRYAASGANAGDEVASWVPSDTENPAPSGMPTPTSIAIDDTGQTYVALLAPDHTGTRVLRANPGLTDSTIIEPSPSENALASYYADPTNPYSTLLRETGALPQGYYSVHPLGSFLASAGGGGLFQVFASAPSEFRWFFDQTTFAETVPTPFDHTDSGVRLLATNGDDRGIVGGGGASGAACDVTRGEDGDPIGVAAGSGGTVFVMIATDHDRDANDAGAQQVVEFGPGGTGCPVPRPEIDASSDSTSVPADGKVAPGSPVTLDASSTDMAGSAATEIDWDLNGNTTDGAYDDGFEVRNLRTSGSIVNEDVTAFLPIVPPDETATASFPSVGDYPVRLRVVTGTGSAIVSRTIHVGFTPPAASVDGPDSATIGDTVVFDASGSTGSGGLTYTWDFGDSDGSFHSGPATTNHVYAARGTYVVRVKATDSHGQTSDPATMQITINPRDDGHATTTTPPPPPPPVPTTATTPPPTPKPGPGSPKVKLTTAQGGTMSLALSCSTSSSACTGTVRVTTLTTVKKGKKKVRRTIVVGTGRFSLAGGKATKLTIKLSRSGQQLLVKQRQLRVSVLVSANGVRGGKEMGATLKPAAKKKAKKKH